MADLWVVTCSGSNDAEYENYMCFSDEFKGIFDSFEEAMKEVQKIVGWYKAKYDEDHKENYFGNYNKEERDEHVFISFSASTKGDWFVWDYDYAIEKVKINSGFADAYIREKENN